LVKTVREREDAITPLCGKPKIGLIIDALAGA
jgi:hypothetical protein